MESNTYICIYIYIHITNSPLLLKVLIFTNIPLSQWKLVFTNINIPIVSNKMSVNCAVGPLWGPPTVSSKLPGRCAAPSISKPGHGKGGNQQPRKRISLYCINWYDLYIYIHDLYIYIYNNDKTLYSSSISFLLSSGNWTIDRYSKNRSTIKCWDLGSNPGPPGVVVLLID